MHEVCIQMLGGNDSTLAVCFVELCADTIRNVSSGGPKKWTPDQLRMRVDPSPGE